VQKAAAVKTTKKETGTYRMYACIETALSWCAQGQAHPSPIHTLHTHPPSPTTHNTNQPKKQGFIDAGDAYTLELDVPGVAPDDLKINLHDGVLTVTGRRKFAAAAAAHDDDADRDSADADDSNGRTRQRQHQQHHHRGRYYYAQYGGRGRGAAVATSCSGPARSGPSSAKFRRAFAVPDDADADRADASLANGVLEVTLPKRAPSPAPEPKTIPVTVRGDAAAAPAPSDKEADHAPAAAAAAAADAPADDAAAAPVDNGEGVNAPADEDGVIEDVPAGEEDDNGPGAGGEGDAEATADAEAWTNVEKADA
jgi:HSP20 family molecular chaperone IbpA